MNASRHTAPLRRRARRGATSLGLAAIGVLAATSAAGATTEPPSDDAAAGSIDCAAIAESEVPPPEIATFVGLVVQTPEYGGRIEGPATVLIPAESAFAAIPENVLSMITDDPELLGALVDYHIIPDELLSAEALVAAGSAATAAGADLTFSETDGVVSVNDGAATVLCPDIANGGITVHIIDSVLQPPASATGAPGSSVPGSSVPGNSIPGSSVPVFDADSQEVADAWQTVTDSSAEIDDVVALIENGEDVRETAENYPVATGIAITTEVRSVTIADTLANITYVLFFDGVEAPYGELEAQLSYVDGQWLVPQDVYCEYQGLARNTVPCGEVTGRG